MESLKKSQTKCQMTLTYFIAKKNYRYPFIAIHNNIVILFCY